MTLACCVISTF